MESFEVILFLFGFFLDDLNSGHCPFVPVGVLYLGLFDSYRFSSSMDPWIII